MSIAEPIKRSAIIHFLRTPFIVLVFLFPGLFAAGQVKFTTMTSSQEIGKNEYLEVEFRVENAKDIDQFTPPDFAGFRQVQEPMQSSGMSDINGAVSQYKSLTYVLQPEKTGKFTIKGATALVDGKKLQSNPVTVSVTAAAPGNSSNANSNPNPFPQLSWPDPSSLEPRDIDHRDYVLKPGEDIDEKIRKNLFLKVQVDKNNCYVGEPVVATYKLYSRVRAESRITKHPSLNGFSVYDMVDPGTEPGSIEKLGGKSFIVRIIRKAQLIPLQPGTIDLDPVEVENTVHFVKGDGQPVHRRSGDAMQDLFDQLSEDDVTGPEVEKNVTLDTKPVTITIKPLPEENKPADFSGAVGKFSISASLVNRNISVQDEADLKIAVAGRGNLPVISAPSVKWPAGMNAFDPTAKEDINKTTVPLSGSKTFDYVFTTSAPGHYTIPAVTLSYFDPADRVYKKIQSNPVDFEVTPAAKKKGLPAGLVVAAPSNEEGTLEDFVQRHLETIFAILILSGLAFYLWRQNTRLKRVEEEKKLNKGSAPGNGEMTGGVRGSVTGLVMGSVGIPEGRAEPSVMAPDLLADVKQRLENGDYPGFYRELNRTVWKAVAGKLDLPASELNKYNIMKSLEAKGWDATTTLSLEHLLNECEMNLYTPDYDTYNMQQLLGQAESLLGILVSNTSY
jgi:predicted component of type VI protein secretion system